MHKTTILLINLGTPKSSKLKHVSGFLCRFLNDRRVIDINKILRFILVNFIIIPLRAKKSVELYKRLWTKEGSPLLVNSLKTQKLLQERFSNYNIELAMRYSEPGMTSVLKRIETSSVDNLIIIPLYPQYASSTTGSIIEESMRIISLWNNIPSIKFVNKFYDNDIFIDAIVANTLKYNIKEYEHILFSYHGLPESHITKSNINFNYQSSDCESEIKLDNQYCYKSSCYATTKLVAQKLGIKETAYSTSFQSRLNNDWIKPYSDKVLIDMAKQGYKRILVISPSFVSDCLETKIEIMHEYREHFHNAGGEQLDLVEGLNYSNRWIDCLEDIVNKNA